MVFGYLLLRLQEGSLRNSIGKYSDPEIPSCLKGPGSFSEGTPLHSSWILTARDLNLQIEENRSKPLASRAPAYHRRAPRLAQVCWGLPYPKCTVSANTETFLRLD